MIDAGTVRELYRYNRWANERTFASVFSLSLEEFTRDLGSSYSSVRDSLGHVVWAEWIWLQRWKGLSPRIIFAATDYPDPAALRTRWLDVETEQHAFLSTLTDERLGSVVSYLNLEGQRWQYPLWRTMYHLVNHSSYHRGQVTTLLRQLRAQPVATDFLVFEDEQERHDA